MAGESVADGSAEAHPPLMRSRCLHQSSAHEMRCSMSSRYLQAGHILPMVIRQASDCRSSPQSVGPDAAIPVHCYLSTPARSQTMHRPGSANRAACRHFCSTSCSVSRPDYMQHACLAPSRFSKAYNMQPCSSRQTSVQEIPGQTTGRVPC